MPKLYESLMTAGKKKGRNGAAKRIFYPILKPRIHEDWWRFTSARTQ